MLQFKILFPIMLLTSYGTSAQNLSKKLDVLVLYESLCPDSERFMQQQLGRNYDELKDFLNIWLVPFGKSLSRDNGALFFCQHGAAECEGNRMQSCVLQQTNDQEQQVKFVVCQMSSSNRSSVKQCAEHAGLSGDIEDCMTTEKGTYLQLQAEEVTQIFKPTFVPTIIYDNVRGACVFDQQLQDSSIRNFRGTVCSLLQKRGDNSFHNVACQ